MTPLEYKDEVVNEIAAALNTVDNELADEISDAILNAPHIFISGAGRSLLSAKGFAMRLVHMGFPAYVLGEIATTDFRPGDLLIIPSGSGETGVPVLMAQKAKKLGGKIVLITITEGSTLGTLADHTLYIRTSTTKIERLKRESDCMITSIQPMGSLFEQCVLLVLDIIIMKLMKRKKLTSDEMFKKHVNLE